MCWLCNRYGKMSLSGGDALTMHVISATADKHTTAFPIDGVGDLKPLFPTGVFVVTPDEAGDGIGLPPGNPTITVGAPSTIGSIGVIGDQDFYAIHLDANVLYQIGMYGYNGGPGGAPLADAYIELYDANGTKLDVADGGGETPGGVLYGLDAMLTVQVATSGTYYINARAFDQNDANGETGDGVGDYELFARISSYTPYYDTNNPLYSIDWGTQVNKVHQSVRNPDGNEGPRDTGNPQGTLSYSDMATLQALATAQGKDITGKNVITVYFAHAGEVYVDDDPSTTGTTETIVAKGFEDWEIAAYKYAFAAYEKVADIVYLVVDSGYDALSQDNPTVDFTFVTYNGTPGPGVSLLGRMSPPDTDNEGQSVFNAADERWTQDGVAPGGFSFTTLIHEMGHGHGLAHPHDNGGHSGVMHGVEAEGVAFDYTNGDFDLNQSVYTMMSYEDGWQKSPYGQADTTDPFGWLKGLMAFDIAAIQDKYGVNEDTAIGDDLYLLEDTNHGTTFDANNNITQFASGFESIWDCGGSDTILYSGSRDANIDLRPASLRYQYGGGGWVSYANGIYGGFTIANGVTIERAIAGSGNDVLTGNDIANFLSGGAGNDYLDGGLGADVLAGGDGNDILIGGSGAANEVIGGTGNDLYYVSVQGDTVYEAAGEGNDTIRTTLNLYTLAANLDNLIFIGAGAFTGTGNGLANVVIGGSANDVIDGGLGADSLAGGDGNDRLIGGSGAANELIGGKGDDTYIVSIQGDTVYEVAGEGNDTVETSLSFYALTAANVENLTGTSNAGQSLLGSAGNDRITGGTGNDELQGGLGNDTYVLLNAGDTIVEQAGGGTDTIETALNYYFMNSANVENLTFTGTGDFYGSGNAGDNVITGGAGADTLRGGLGLDTLVGGAGSDFYLFDTAPSAGNADTITGFVSAADRILLDNAVFAALSDGGLAPGAFVAGTAAQDADDRILYDAATGNLYYDADGNGGGAAVLFATLQGHPTLVASDFTVI